MQIVIVLALLLLLSMCSNAKHAVFGSTQQPASPAVVSCDATDTDDDGTPSFADIALMPHPAVNRSAYAIGRPDGGASFYVPFEAAGETKLIDTALPATTRVVGVVYNDPATFSTIVQVGTVIVGVKPDGSYKQIRR